MVKISEAIGLSFDILKQAVPSPRGEAEHLAAFVLGKDRLHLAIHKNDEMPSDCLEKLKLFSNQRAKGKPLAYITGIKEFMSLEFEVNKNVLIPRPETEELAEYIIELYKDKNVKILDLCTGSGAICISLAHYIDSAFCKGVDISPLAIETAKRNAKKLGVDKRCEFEIYDVLSPKDMNQKFDVVVSNPPYIETNVIEALEATVKDFEPRLALDGGHDGLLFYKKIAQSISLYLKKGGMLFLEIGYNQGEELKEIMAQNFDGVKIIKDLSGHDRIAIGRYKG